MAKARSRNNGAWSRPSVAWAAVPTPLGVFHVVVGPRGLLRVELPGARFIPPSRLPVKGYEKVAVEEGGERIDLASAELREYLGGTRRSFDLPLDPQGTDFDRSVWQAVAAVAYAEVRTYADVARAIRRPGAFRAVGAANGRNPLPIFIPCHRIVGTGGRLTGYGGGLSLKARLLRHEGRILSRDVADAGTTVLL